MADTGSDNPNTTPADAQKRSHKPSKKWLIENVLSLGLALLIVFMIRSSVVEAFKIPSGSMIPTLLIGDHIFVNKFAYGVKVPFSDIELDFEVLGQRIYFAPFGGRPVYAFEREPAKRGDIIVFKYPKDKSFYYIKRVIGVPGDTVEIRENSLYINGQLIKRDAVSGPEYEQVFQALDDPRYSRSNLDLFVEHIDGVDHLMMLDKNRFIGESHGPITIPEKSLFVMGDNRDFSNDSRFWGFVPFDNVKGKAMVIWLSLWISFSDSQFVFRPDRIGTLLK